MCDGVDVTLVIGHRGASAAAPENTLEAFLKAREVGADWVELDVRRTADGVAVVHHDAHMTDGRRIGQTHAGRLPSHIPSLAEALEACEGMGVIVEIKNLPDDPDYDDENLVAFAVAGLTMAYLDPDRFVVSSFDVSPLAAVKAADPAIPIALICGLIDPASAVARAEAHDMSGVHPYDAMCSTSFVRRAHGSNLDVFVWTVNRAERMAELVEMGVDGIITDYPDVARAVVDAAR